METTLCKNCIGIKDSIGNKSVYTQLIAADVQYNRNNKSSASGTYQEALAILAAHGGCARCKRSIQESINRCL